MKVQWKHLYEFIQEKIKEDPSFLENQLMIEMVSPEHCAPEGGWKRNDDEEGWSYVEPAGVFNNADGTSDVRILSTHIPSKKIVTININY